MSNHLLQNIEDQAILEGNVFHIFKKRYSLTYPPPEKPGKKLKESLDWQFWATLFTSLFNVVLAATRTAQAFFAISILQIAALAEQFPKISALEVPFGIFEAFIAIAGVELTLLVFSTRRSIQKRKDDPDAQIDDKRLWTGIILTAFISIVAGTAQSLFAVENPAAWLVTGISYLLMLATGPAISIAVIISGEILGHVLADATLELQFLQADYVNDSEAWQTKMLSNFNRNKRKMMTAGGYIQAPSPKKGVPADEPKTKPVQVAPDRPEYWHAAKERYGRNLTIKETIMEHVTVNNIAIEDLKPAAIYALYPDYNENSVRVMIHKLKGEQKGRVQ